MAVALGGCGDSGSISAPSGQTPSAVPGVAAVDSTATTVTPTTATTTRAVRPRRVLLYSRTSGFRHTSIPVALAAIVARAREPGVDIVATEDPSIFTDQQMQSFGAVAFVMTTGNVLDGTQQLVVERFVRGGGGFVGVHSAADTEYDWPFYGELVGAWFAKHPAIQRATLNVEDRSHPSTAHLPVVWERVDEWYCFRTNPRSTARILLTVDETSYGESCMGADHPMAWWHERLGGRSWYTACGHTEESWADPLFVDHVWGGVQFVLGTN